MHAHIMCFSMAPFILLRRHIVSDKLLGGSQERAIYRRDLCDKSNYIFLYKWYKSVIFSFGRGTIDSLPYCSCETDFVRCHDGMTNSIQKG